MTRDGGDRIRPCMAWTRMSPQGKRSQRIGAWWKPEEPEPCWICPLSYRLNGVDRFDVWSLQFDVGATRNLRTSNLELRTPNFPK